MIRHPSSHKISNRTEVEVAVEVELELGPGEEVPKAQWRCGCRGKIWGLGRGLPAGYFCRSPWPGAQTPTGSGPDF